jgi:hypothetical protein
MTRAARMSQQVSIEVSVSTTKRRVCTWMSLALISLALSILGWGTGYRVYRCHSSDDSSHLMQPAKLLSTNEQNSPTDKTLIGRIKDTTRRKEMRTSLTLLFLAYIVSVIAAFQASSLNPGARATGRHWHLRQHVSLTFFFVLPPPILA